VTFLEQVGQTAIVRVENAGALTLQFLSVLRKLPRVLPIVGVRRRWRSSVEQMLAIGASALPMAGAMSLCTGFILALQGASELRKFGALELVVSLVAISFTRELGPLITALSVSGRSASAITAEIGTMVVTEEIDALRVMGLDPVEFTLAPKYLAAVITLPCLTVLSTVCGIFAGYLFLAFSMDMSLRVSIRSAHRRIGGDTSRWGVVWVSAWCGCSPGATHDCGLRNAAGALPKCLRDAVLQRDRSGNRGQ
jgi:phospholipid/cholesterol/gamma-HCH transport system permease protein